VLLESLAGLLKSDRIPAVAQKHLLKDVLEDFLRPFFVCVLFVFCHLQTFLWIIAQLEFKISQSREIYIQLRAIKNSVHWLNCQFCFKLFLHLPVI